MCLPYSHHAVHWEFSWHGAPHPAPLLPGLPEQQRPQAGQQPPQRRLRDARQRRVNAARQRLHRSSAGGAALILGLQFLLLMFHIGQVPLLGPDEPRYARVAVEMARNHEFVTPTLAGEPWLEKPPLYYWLAGLGYRLFGERGLGTDQFPAPDRPLRGDRIGYHLRPGAHDITPYDWAQFLEFADRHLKRAPRP